MNEQPDTATLKHRGYRLQISNTETDWCVLVTQPGTKLVLIAASDREGALRLAFRKVDELLAVPAATEGIA